MALREPPHATPLPHPDADTFDPDAEALALAARVVAHVRVARSLVRIASLAAREGARHVVRHASATPELARLRVLAKAALEATSDVTAAEIARAASTLDALTRKPSPPAPAEAPVSGDDGEA